MKSLISFLEHEEFIIDSFSDIQVVRSSIIKLSKRGTDHTNTGVLRRTLLLCPSDTQVQLTVPVTPVH